MGGKGAGGRSRKAIPLLRVLAKIPKMKLPISLYLDWVELIDDKEENRDVETHLVRYGYLKDPDFDKWYLRFLRPDLMRSVKCFQGR